LNEPVVTYTYNSLNRLTNVGMTKASTTLASYAYTIGAAGNRLSVTEQSGRVVTYSYDNLYRLTQEQIASDPLTANNGTLGYSYDADHPIYALPDTPSTFRSSPQTAGLAGVSYCPSLFQCASEVFKLANNVQAYIGLDVLEITIQGVFVCRGHQLFGQAKQGGIFVAHMADQVGDVSLRDVGKPFNCRRLMYFQSFGGIEQFRHQIAFDFVLLFNRLQQAAFPGDALLL
jgi:YD repeat-containing protein